MAVENLCALPRLNEAERQEYWAALALRCCRGLGARTARRLLDRYGSAYGAVRQVADWRALGLGRQVEYFLSDQWREAAKVEWDAARGLVGEVLLWTDPRYPEVLREIPDAPLLLYMRGCTRLLSEVGVGVVGMRHCSPRGARDARVLAGGLAAACLTVISGLAAGVDGHAHAAALDLPGSTIAVLGTGLDVPYPPINTGLYDAVAEKGLLLSEFAPGTRPEARNFPIRNRIISGLSMGVLVVEAAPQSGSLITARLALEQNRAVYAVGGAVGDPRSEGCQELIRQGAVPVFGAGDILSDLWAVLIDRGDTRLRIDLPDAATDEPDAEPEAAPVAVSARPAPPDSPPPLPGATLRAASVTASAKAAHPAASAPPATSAISVTSVTSAIPATSATSANSANSATSATSEKPATADAAAFTDTPDLPLPRRMLALLAHSPRTIDQICETLDAAPAQVSAELIILEVRRCVRRMPDTRYALFE